LNGSSPPPYVPPNTKKSDKPMKKSNEKGQLTPRFNTESKGKTKWVSCADNCEGEHVIVSSLKAGNKTPKCCLDLLYETTLYVDNLLTKHGITYWAMKGTMLGVIREHGYINFDYDIDLAFQFEDINKIAALRNEIWNDGYVLFQAPWPGYNNMQFVIMKRVKSVRDYFAANPIGNQLPRFEGAIRELGISAELMAFTTLDGWLVQVLCTSTLQDGTYDAVLSPDIQAEFHEDYTSYQSRASSSVDGWLKYADSNDKAWVSYKTKFDNHNVSPMCQRIAPFSFHYENLVEDVLPPVRMPYFNHFIPVAKNYEKFAVNYFGANWKTPKRRYGN